MRTASTRGSRGSSTLMAWRAVGGGLRVGGAGGGWCWWHARGGRRVGGGARRPRVVRADGLAGGLEVKRGGCLSEGALAAAAVDADARRRRRPGRRRRQGSPPASGPARPPQPPSRARGGPSIRGANARTAHRRHRAPRAQELNRRRALRKDRVRQQREPLQLHQRRRVAGPGRGDGARVGAGEGGIVGRVDRERRAGRRRVGAGGGGRVREASAAARGGPRRAGRRAPGARRRPARAVPPPKRPRRPRSARRRSRHVGQRRPPVALQIAPVGHI